MDHPETPAENVSCEVYVATDAVSEVREALKELRGRGEKHPLRATEGLGLKNGWLVFFWGDGTPWLGLRGTKRKPSPGTPFWVGFSGNGEETESSLPAPGPRRSLHVGRFFVGVPKGAIGYVR